MTRQRKSGREQPADIIKTLAVIHRVTVCFPFQRRGRTSPTPSPHGDAEALSNFMASGKRKNAPLTVQDSNDWRDGGQRADGIDKGAREKVGARVDRFDRRLKFQLSFMVESRFRR